MKTKEECLLMNGVLAFDLGKVEKRVLKAMDEYKDQPPLPYQAEQEEPIGYLRVHKFIYSKDIPKVHLKDYQNPSFGFTPVFTRPITWPSDEEIKTQIAILVEETGLTINSSIKSAYFGQGFNTGIEYLKTKLGK